MSDDASQNMPLSQLVQTEAAFPEYLPEGQVMQTEAPVAEYVFAGHDRHKWEPLSAYFPAAQTVHAVTSCVIINDTLTSHASAIQ